MSAEADRRQANKFSRQNAALGAETTKFLGTAKVLVVGLRGCGVEVVKNCLLQGLGSVTLYDPTPASLADSGANFFICAEDCGRPRDEVCRSRLQELNPDAVVTVVQELTEAVVGAMTCLVFAGVWKREEVVKWNAFCRSRTRVEVDERGGETRVSAPISFVWCVCAGLATTIFVDHGGAFRIADSDGERPIVRLVESISREQRGLVRYMVPDGVAATSPPEASAYQFSEVVGCQVEHDWDAISALAIGGASLNASPPWRLAHLEGDPANSFRIGDTRALTPYVSGGLISEKKVARIASFKSLADRLQHPGFPGDGMTLTDYTFSNREMQMHCAFCGALEFEAQHQRPPNPNDEGDADAVLQLAKHFVCATARADAFAGKASEWADFEVDADFARAYARHCAVELQPLACFAGGLVAQEVVKCAGKYTPIDGFAHFSFFEVLPEPPPSLADRAARGCRYDDLISVFGMRFVEHLANLKYFVIGSGALGCEFVKNFALNGVCCGPRGKLVIADADRIELSNLTRQFLFREHNVGHAKSVAAAAMAVDPGPRTCANAMNRDLRVAAVEAYVGAKTEATLFDDAFWLGLDGVCNALDNMEARFYVDAQCVKFELPLLESGTMGTSGNVEPIVPHKTKTYREGGAAAEGGGIPMCTLRNFPHLIEHCIEWARDKFAELFVRPAEKARKLLAAPEGVLDEFCRKVDSQDATVLQAALVELEQLLATVQLAAVRPGALRRQFAAQRAFDAFHALFRDQILDLVHAYPADARLKDKDGRDKGPFWSGHKKFPTALRYDGRTEAHWRFLVSTTHLVAQMVGAQPRKMEDDDSYAAEERSAAFGHAVAQALEAPKYASKKVDATGIPDAGGGAAAKTEAGDDDALRERGHVIIADLRTVLAQAAVHGALDVEAADFEKDDDYNFHVDFITACANCRAANYAIAATDYDAAKLTAGRIIPAIATTTAAVTGLVMLELFKIVQGKPATALRTRQVGLALNYYPSFDADNLVIFKTRTELVKPDASLLGAEAFGRDGKILDAFLERRTSVAYPDPHTVWTKLRAPPEAAGWTTRDLKMWLLESHGLKLTAWNLDVFDSSAEKRTSTRVYPVPAAVDFASLPALNLTKPQAMAALMRGGLRGAAMMRHLAEWEKCKKCGALPAATPGNKALEDMTIREILEIKGKLDVASRRFVILDGLSCSTASANQLGDAMDLDEDCDVEKLAPVVITLAR